jgi:hypothetical protein
MCAICFLVANSYPAVTMKFFNWTDLDVNKLSYYKKLGYTHVAVHVDFNGSLFSHSTGHWVYNNKIYTSGNMAVSFAARLKQARDAGLTPVPIFECFTHTNDYIALDNTISEFNAAYPKPTISQLNTIDPCTVNWDANAQAGYLSYDGNAAPCELTKNQGADDIYNELFQIIKNNWGSGMPPYIHIGHDEMGYGCACYVKLGKSKARSESIAQLVAMEINARFQQIDAVFGSGNGIKVCLWGDAFLPSDYGETYGTAGNLQTGNGGILKILDQSYGRKSRTVVMPWMYSCIDGAYEAGRNLIFSKIKQLAYLDMLGYDFVPCGGEDYDAQTSFNSMELIKQTTFEWIRASQIYPMHLVGLGHCTWVSFTNTYGTGAAQVYVSLQMPRYNSYSPRMWKNVNFLKSRQDMANSGASASWTEGIHYFRPPLTGVLHVVSESN